MNEAFLIIRRRALQITILLAILLAFGTIGFILVAGYTPFDAFYMTAITITTVGYAEIEPLDRAGRIFRSRSSRSGRAILVERERRAFGRS